MPDDQTPMPKSKEAPAPVTQVSKTWLNAINPGMSIWAQPNAALLAQMGDMVATMHLFSQSRLKANIDACESLVSCGDPAELVRQQRDYMETATAQYSRHARDMSERTGAMIAAAAKRPAPKS